MLWGLYSTRFRNVYCFSNGDTLVICKLNCREKGVVWQCLFANHLARGFRFFYKSKLSHDRKIKSFSCKLD